MGVSHRSVTTAGDRELVLLAAGTTATAEIPGISAAGADPTLRYHTPAADAEIVTYGDVVGAPDVPLSPTGCPTPAVVTRAARELLGFEWATIDAGIPHPGAAPTVDTGTSPGQDIREAVAVPEGESIVENARGVARALPVDRLAVAETIPAGTTTALAVLQALGERSTVSSSLPDNPLDQKRAVVEEALAASEIAPGDCSGAPIDAVRAVGDPVQATVLGLVLGATEAGIDLECWGGTQALTMVALARHAGCTAELSVATTSYVAEDDSAAVRALADDVDASLTVTDPGFAGHEHVALERFEAGEAKEGVGMGGALARLDRAGRLSELPAAVTTVYDRICPPEVTDGR